MYNSTTDVKLFVDQHIKEVKTIHSVAERLQVHYDTLRKSFLRHEQIALADYITRQKVQAMKEHLVMGDDPCFFICYEYGYREDSGAKIFKKLTGMTMLEYRRKHRAAQQNTEPRPTDIN
ncbi:MAG: helix-turn-helix domain-containing protein [Bacteroidetes bacterium]|nr:helix-turn-helix domain-containing protein [Bacteroidota bacterium]